MSTKLKSNIIASSIFTSASLASYLSGSAKIATAVSAGIIGTKFIAKLRNKDKELITAISYATVDVSNLEIKKLYDFYLALAAVSYYTARANNIITIDEKAEIDYSLRLILDECIIPNEIENEFLKIANNENLNFSDIIPYLNNISIADLSKLSMTMKKIISIDENTKKEVESVQYLFNLYSNYRSTKAATNRLEEMVGIN